MVFIKPDTHVYSGENITLRCDIQRGGKTQWTYSWYKNNKPLYAEENTTITRQEHNIKSVRDSDSGDFTCSGQSGDSQSSEISDAVELTVSSESKYQKFKFYA